jgi:hypothetical protein
MADFFSKNKGGFFKLNKTISEITKYDRNYTITPLTYTEEKFLLNKFKNLKGL